MSMRFWSALAFATVGAACNKTETAAPAAQTPPPAQAVAPTQPGQPASAPGGEAAPAAAPFTGELSLGEGLSAADLKPTDVLFIMAREGGGEGAGPGRLVAVQRHTEVAFPKQFSVGSGDAMVPGSPFTGPFAVTARIDRDGDPMTKTADDLYAAATGPVMAGQGAVNLVFRKGTDKDAAPAMPMGHPGSPPAGAAPH
jgi:hypothetical protein